MTHCVITADAAANRQQAGPLKRSVGGDADVLGRRRALNGPEVIPDSYAP